MSELQQFGHQIIGYVRASLQEILDHALDSARLNLPVVLVSVDRGGNSIIHRMSEDYSLHEIFHEYKTEGVKFPITMAILDSRGSIMEGTIGENGYPSKMRWHWH